MAKKSANIATEEDLAGLLAESLNKKSKDQKVAYFLDDDTTPTNVPGWVSSGSDILDLAVSNRPNGGFPMGRIIELTGLEQSGKSLMAAHTLASTQRLGGVAVLIDTETAVSREFLEAIGVDVSKLVYVSADSVEQVFEYTETIIEKVRTGTTNKDRPVTIVIDSMAAASTEKELDADYAKDGYATDKAIIISKAMRKITNVIGREKITLIVTNQLRQKLNAMAFTDPWTTSGGKALGFHASVRLRLKNIGTIKDSKKEKVLGIKVRAQVIKNRMGPPLRAADFDILFDRGIDNYGSWLGVLKDNGIVKQGGSWYTYIDDESGEELKFQAKDFIQILEEREDIRTQMYQKICDASILKYKKKGETDDLDLDDLVQDDEVIE
jgi:recombination protein RecA